MLEIREQILSAFKQKRKLTLSEGSGSGYEIMEFLEGEFIYYGGSSPGGKEEFRYILSPKQALAKICAHYRSKAGIEAEPGYKQVYAYMMENP